MTVAATAPNPGDDGARSRQGDELGGAGMVTEYGMRDGGEPAHLVGDISRVEHADCQRPKRGRHFRTADSGGAQQVLPVGGRSLFEKQKKILGLEDHSSPSHVDTADESQKMDALELPTLNLPRRRPVVAKPLWIAAAVGMALGLAQYVAFRRNLGTHGRTVPNPLPRSAIGWAVGVGVVVVAAIVVAFVTGLVKLSNLSQVTTGVIILASVAYFVVMLTSSKVAATERTRVRAFIPLFIANAVFWSLFQQIFTVLAVYSDERMNWSIFGWTAPLSWIGSG